MINCPFKLTNALKVFEELEKLFSKSFSNASSLAVFDLIIVHQAAGEEDILFFFGEAFDVEGEVFDVT